MRTYRVTWTIDIEADSPLEAAKEALRIQRDEESVATIFDVAATSSAGGVSGPAVWVDVDSEQTFHEPPMKAGG